MNMPSKEIQKLRETGKARTQDFVKQYHGNPKPFRDSTWLYIRSFDTDDGSRSPINTPPEDGVFWLSPDIELYDSSGANVDRLVTGHRYRVEVTVRNAGDLHAHSCSVELYLCDPALGFDLASPNTVFLDLGRVEVMSGNTATVAFTFVAGETNIGHKCMFARVHSVVNREIPAIVFTLDPFNNRHDAQQNLVIAEGGEIIAMSMAMSAPENNDVTLFIRAADTLPKHLLERKQLQFMDFMPKKEAAAFEGQFLVMPLKGKEGLSFGPKARIKVITKLIAKQYKLNLEALVFQAAKQYNVDLQGSTSPYLLSKGGSSFWSFSMQGTGVQSVFLRVPEIELMQGQAAVFQIFTVDSKKKRVGGITLIVKG